MAAELELRPQRDGALPSDATIVEGNWSARADPDAPGGDGAICQTIGGPTGLMPLDFLLVDKRFPLLALGGLVARDFRATAAFKLLDGNVDRAAGIAFWIRDQDNYWVVRANALESNVNLYRFVDGRRQLLHEVQVAVPSGTWQRLALEVRGARIRWALSGQSLAEIDASDGGPGGFGLWTKADSVTCFDLVHIQVG